MSISDIPTNPIGVAYSLNIETTPILPEIPQGHILRIIVDIVIFKQIWRLQRNIETQNQYDLYRILARHSETKNIRFTLVPRIPKPPKLPNVVNPLWKDIISD